jgi:CRP-like cAMP-binding protein
VAQPQQNLILSRLSRDDLALIQPHLEPVDLPLRKVLGQANKKITAVYFPQSGIASVVVNTGKPIEVGLIGREGMTGLALVFGGDRDNNETYMQAAGQGQRMRANDLRNVIYVRFGSFVDLDAATI